MLRAFGVSRVVSNGMGTLAGHGGGKTWGTSGVVSNGMETLAGHRVGKAWGNTGDLVVTGVANGKEVFAEEEMVIIESRSGSAWVNGAVVRQCLTQ